MLVLQANKELEKVYKICFMTVLDKKEKDKTGTNGDSEPEKKVDAKCLAQKLKESFGKTGIPDLDNLNPEQNDADVIPFLERYVCLPYEDLLKLWNILKNRREKAQEAKEKNKEDAWKKEIEYFKPLLADYLYDALVSGVSQKQIKEKYNYDGEQFCKDYSKYFNHNKHLKINNLIVGMQETKTCIYCNGQYIDNRDDRVVAQLDHLFAKSVYPHLAICLYNLVPSCSNCNVIKQSSDKLFQSPYDKKYKLEHFKFCLDIGPNILDADSKFEMQYKIDEEIYNRKTLKDIEKDIDPMINNLIEMKISDFYSNRRDEVKDIIQKKLYLEKSTIELLKNINKDLDDIIINKMVFGEIPDDEELKNIPLSKMKRDIMEYLKIIEKNKNGGYKFVKN